LRPLAGKWGVLRAGGSGRRRGASLVLWRGVLSGGGWLPGQEGGDFAGVGVDGLQLVDEAADLAVAVDVGVVVVRAEVVVAGLGVGEQVADDDQDGAGDGGQGLALAAAPGDPPVAFAGEGAGAGGGGGDLAGDAARVGVAFAGRGVAGLRTPNKNDKLTGLGSPVGSPPHPPCRRRPGARPRTVR
jgi:hypothetical protein